MSAPSGQDWRGVAAEDVDDITTRLSILLRDRSRRLFGALVRPHRRALWTVVAMVCVQSFAALSGPWLVSIAMDTGVPRLIDGDWTPLLLVVGAMMAMGVLAGLLRRAYLLRMGRVGQDLLLSLRRRIFNHFQLLSLSFHEKYTSGRVISRQTNDVESINELLDAGLDGMVNALLSVVTIGVILLILDPPLAAVTMLAFPLLFWLMAWFRKHSSVAYRRTREAVALVIVQFVETFGGIRAVQAFRRERRNEEIFGALSEDYRQANYRAMTLLGIFVPGVKLLGSLTIVAVLIYGAWRVMDGDLQIGVLTAFLLYVRRFFDPMQEIAMFYNSFQSALAALEKISGVLEETSTVAEPAHPTRLTHARGEVDFDDVRFAYRADGDDILPAMRLHVPAGQTVALVGATGAGKSTLARLLARFYDPREGTVRVDGIDLRDLAEDDLRRAVVMVTQENYLFSGSVADNIAVGKPGASRDEIVAAATAIGAHEFISALPAGYDTDVRKRGGRLSAGQRQLVAFARAFIADPGVLILDEATSSLDVPSERMVQRALRTILRDRTAVIIAHRLSTVEIADRVLVMDAGRIVEDGQPAELVAGTGRFAALHTAWRDSLV